MNKVITNPMIDLNKRRELCEGLYQLISNMSMEPNMNLKPYTGPPYSWRVLVDGKWRKMSGFDEEHIQNQLAPKKAKKILKKLSG